MPSTYSSNLRLELQATGENRSTWGIKANNDFELIEDAIAGYVVVTIADANMSLSAVNGAVDQSRMAIIAFNGTLTATRTVTIPSVSKIYFLRNATTGGFGVTVKTASGNNLTVPNGKTLCMFCDATNVYWSMLTNATDLIGSVPLLNGGTGGTDQASARAGLGLAAIAASGSGNDITTGTVADARLPATMAGKTFSSTVVGTRIELNGSYVTSGAEFIFNNNSNKHVWFRNGAGTNRALLYNDATDNSLRLNLYNTSGTFIRAATYRESDGRFEIDGYLTVGTGTIAGGDFTASRGDGSGVIFLGGGSRYLYYDGSKYILPGANLLVGSATLQIDGNVVFAGGMTAYGATLAAALTNKVTVNTGDAGSARWLKSGGTAGGTNMQFNWSGLGGQPQWVWGGDAGSTGTQMYVYNPLNWTVANADTVDGYHATDLAQVYKGSDANLTNFPIGTMLYCYTGAAVNRNSTQTVYVSTAGASIAYDLRVLGGAYVPLSGSWAVRGIYGNQVNMQRIA